MKKFMTSASVAAFGLLLIVQAHAGEPQKPVEPQGDCPLTIDVLNDGITVTSRTKSHAYFDLNGDGIPEHTAWVSGYDNALLVVDRNGNGVIDGIAEAFGGPGLSGFTDLANKEDTNRDGAITVADANWSNLRLWIDVNSDGWSEAEELLPLAHYDIVAINLAATDVRVPLGPDSYIGAIGTTRFGSGREAFTASVFYTNQADESN